MSRHGIFGTRSAGWLVSWLEHWQFLDYYQGKRLLRVDKSMLEGAHGVYHNYAKLRREGICQDSCEEASGPTESQCLPGMPHHESHHGFPERETGPDDLGAGLRKGWKLQLDTSTS